MFLMQELAGVQEILLSIIRYKRIVGNSYKYYKQEPSFVQFLLMLIIIAIQLADHHQIKMGFPSIAL